MLVHNRSCHFRTESESSKVILEAVAFHGEIISIWRMLSKTMTVVVFLEFSLSAYVIISGQLSALMVSSVAKVVDIL